MIMMMIKELLLRRISSGLTGALHTLKLKEKFNEKFVVPLVGVEIPLSVAWHVIHRQLMLLKQNESPILLQ